MNKTFLALGVVGSIALPTIAYSQRESIRDHVDLLLNNPDIEEMRDREITYMLLDSIQGKASKYEGVLYDCLQDIPEECYDEEKK